MRINLISHNNGVGLSVDIALIKSVLSEHAVNVIDLKRGGRRVYADVNIFLELIDPKCFRLADINIFIPNPEWFWDIKYLHKFDFIFAKTRDAERVFKELGCRNVLFTSFTSPDKFMPKIKKERVYLHMAGKSSMKGTEVVHGSWKSHPDWPMLVFGKIEKYGKYKDDHKNIGRIFTRINDDEMKVLQNRCAIHICTSEYEGFGHYIHEAKSCGAVIVSTDAPPMNEFVTKETGFLVPYSSTEPFNYGTLHRIGFSKFEKVIEETIGVSDKELSILGDKSRQSFVDNDKYFRSTLKEIMKNVR